MLIATGTFNGKEYKDSLITATELAKAFGLPGVSDTNILKLHPTRVTKDRAGQTRSPRSLQVMPEYNLTDGENSLILRYYTRATPGKNGNKEYHPRRLKFSGNPSFARDRYDLYVYMALHPRTDGPNKANAIQPYFSIYDAAKENALIKMKADLLQSLITDIQNTDQQMLMIKARGLGVNGGEWGTVFMGLMNMVNADPIAFQNKWTSDVTTNAGLIMLAGERGIIESTTNLGQNIWQWGGAAPKDRIGNKICNITQDEPYRELIQFVSDPSNYMEIMPVLRRVLSGGEEKATNNPPTPTTQAASDLLTVDNKTSDLVNRLIDAGTLVVVDGLAQLSGETVFVVEEGQDLATAAVNYLTENKDQELLFRSKLIL